MKKSSDFIYFVEIKEVKCITIYLVLFFLTFALIIPSVQAQKLTETIEVEGILSIITLSPNGEYVYLTRTGGVSIMSTTNKTVIDTITLPSFYSKFMEAIAQVTPSGIAITPDGKYLFVTNLGSDGDNAIYKIDTTTNKVEPIDGLLFPSGITITPNGRYAYIITTKYTKESSHSISILDIATNKIITSIKFPNSLRSVSITPNGEYAYITSSTGRTVTVISTVNKSIITTIPNLNYPIGIEFAPDGKYVYVTNCLTDSPYGFTSGEVVVIDTNTNTIVDRIGNLLSPSAIALTADGTHAYVTNPSQGTISVIDIGMRKVISNITDVASSSVVISPDGKYVYAFSYGVISVINPAMNPADVSPIPTSTSPTPTSATSAQIIIMLALTSALVFVIVVVFYRRFHNRKGSKRTRIDNT